MDYVLDKKLLGVATVGLHWATNRTIVVQFFLGIFEAAGMVQVQVKL